MALQAIQLPAANIGPSFWEQCLGKPLVDFANMGPPPPWPLEYAETCRARHTRFDKFRTWLIKLVVGKRSVVANVDIFMHGRVTFKSRCPLTFGIDVVPS